MTKVCSKCKEEKELNLFGKDKATKDGLYPSCKDCRKKWREENKEYRRQYCIKNEDIILAKQKGGD